MPRKTKAQKIRTQLRRNKKAAKNQASLAGIRSNADFTIDVEHSYQEVFSSMFSRINNPQFNRITIASTPSHTPSRPSNGFFELSTPSPPPASEWTGYYTNPYLPNQYREPPYNPCQEVLLEPVEENCNYEPVEEEGCYGEDEGME